MKFSQDEIKNEYNEASREHDEFAKVKWGSQEKMLNRFRLALSEFDFAEIDRWLDVGCGTGAFQKIVTDQYPSVQAVGLDISEGLLKYASSRGLGPGISFKLGDFMEYRETGFDLISCIGVLQKTTFNMDEFFFHAYSLLNNGGRIFLDTKNINWEAFKQPDFHPEDTHLWFDMDDITGSALKAGFKILKAKGFLPDSGQVVEPEKSHTIFMIGEK